MKRLSCVVLAYAVLLGACGGGGPAAEPKPPEGRAETRGIRNTEALGYSGDAIADDVDRALDANDHRKADLDRQLDGTEAAR